MKNRIREFRKEKGISQKKLADAIGVSFQSISFFERGDKTPSIENWIKLANFFNVSVPELQGYKNTDITISKINKLVKEKPNDDYTKSVVAESIRQVNNSRNKEFNRLNKQLKDIVSNLDVLELQIVIMFANFLKNIDSDNSDNDELINEIYIAVAIINNLVTDNYDDCKKTKIISKLKKIIDILINSISTNKD